MATASDKEDKEESRSKSQEADLSYLTCSICFDWYKTPRILPVCSHKFCEDCLYHYVIEQNANKDVKCPVCRQVTPAPGIDQDALKWIQVLELDSDIAEKLQLQSAETNLDLCARCKESKTVTKATKYCFNCQEFLCDNCSDIGHRYKVLRNHSVVDVEGSEKFIREDWDTTKILSGYMSCPLHPDNNFTLLCKNDDSLYCTDCVIKDHVNLPDLVEIEAHANKVQNEKEADDLANTFDKLEAFGEVIISSKKANEAQNKKDTERIKTEIRDIRTKVNVLFDNLELNVVQRCKDLTKKYTLVAEDDIEKLQEVMNKINISRSVLEKSKSQGSTCLLYIALQHLKRKLREYEESILEMKQHCKKFGFEFKTRGRLDDMLAYGPNDTDDLAAIDKTEDTMALPDYTDRFLFKYLSVSETARYQIRVQDAELDPLYVGIACLSDNRMVLVDSHNGLCCLVHDDKVVGTCTITPVSTTMRTLSHSQPYSVTYLKNDIVAVSVPERKKIYFLSTYDDLRIKCEISTKNKPVDLHSLRNGDLAVSWTDPVAFGILSFSHCCHLEEKVYFDSDTHGRVFKSYFSMAIDEERSHVLQASDTDQKLYCFDFQGNPKFACSYPESAINSYIFGLAIDRDGNAYLCDQTSIHILSPDGIYFNCIQNSRTKPLAVMFKPNGFEFVVTNVLSGNESEIIVYKLHKEEQR